MANNLFPSPLRVGNDSFEPGRAEEPFFQGEKGKMEGIQPVGPPFDPGVQLSSLDEPLPMAAVTGPINILVQGPFKTVDDIESLTLEELLGEEGKAQGFQERGALYYGDTVENGCSLSCRGLI